MSPYERATTGLHDVDLELSGVRKTFGSTVAVDNLDLQVRKGEFLFLLGPSGCGKTTTLRMIAGFIQPDQGEIIIRGRNMSRVPPHKRGLGMVFQDYALFPHMSVFHNVAFGLRMHKVPKRVWPEKVRQALALVRLEGLEDRYPKQLSGGQQQRVALARALVIEPAVLLLDEPLSNLDLKLRQQMRVELRQLQEALGITTIFVTHDQEEALSMADRIAVMDAGRINQLGSAKEIYEHPRSRFIADFIGESNFFQGRVAQITEAGEAIVEVEAGWRVWGKAPAGLRVGQRVSVAVRPEKIVLLDHLSSQFPNCFPAEVITTVFIGSYTRFQLALPGQIPCLAQQQNTRGIRHFQKGDPVHVAWEVEDSLILPEG